MTCQSHYVSRVNLIPLSQTGSNLLTNRHSMPIKHLFLPQKVHFEPGDFNSNLNLTKPLLLNFLRPKIAGSPIGAATSIEQVQCSVFEKAHVSILLLEDTSFVPWHLESSLVPSRGRGQAWIDHRYPCSRIITMMKKQGQINGQPYAVASSMSLVRVSLVHKQIGKLPVFNGLFVRVPLVIRLSWLVLCIQNLAS